MVKIVEDLREEWRSFAHDQRGKRFANHYHRAQESRSVAKTAFRSAIGVVLIFCGVVMWFIPGPGWLFIFFGLSMFASESLTLAKVLDRVEVVARGLWQRIRQRWRKTSTFKTLMFLVALAVVVGLGSAAVWAWIGV